MNIDPKTDRCVDPLVALLDRLDAWERVCIGAFSDRRLARVRELWRGAACTSMGPLATATARIAARQRPDAAARGRLPAGAVRAATASRSSPSGSCAPRTARAPGSRLDDRRRADDAPAARHRRRRDHDQPPAPTARRATEPRVRAAGCAAARTVTLASPGSVGTTIQQTRRARHWPDGQFSTIGPRHCTIQRCGADRRRHAVDPLRELPDLLDARPAEALPPDRPRAGVRRDRRAVDGQLRPAPRVRLLRRRLRGAAARRRPAHGCHHARVEIGR